MNDVSAKTANTAGSKARLGRGCGVAFSAATGRTGRCEKPMGASTRTSAKHG